MQDNRVGVVPRRLFSWIGCRFVVFSMDLADLDLTVWKQISNRCVADGVVRRSIACEKVEDGVGLSRRPCARRSTIEDRNL